METKLSQRERLLRYAAENYGTTPEYPWDGTPDAAVLRHPGNQKWYGLPVTYTHLTLPTNSRV